MHDVAIPTLRPQIGGDPPKRGPRIARFQPERLCSRQIIIGKLLKPKNTGLDTTLRELVIGEAKRLARYERALLESDARCLVVSEAERATLGSAGQRAIVNPNGVDLTSFPFTPGQGHPHRIVFVGNLAYPPNIDGVLWFVENVLPRVRARLPQSELVIVGPRAPRRIRRLTERPGIIVTGVVPDVHALVAASQVAVAPLRIGAGIQNKILEAMATGTAVVATPRAIGGIDVEPNIHCLVAGDAARFAEAVTTLLVDEELRRTLVHAAHDLVTTRYTWDRTVGNLEALYDDMVRAAGDP